jgi:hypothetical protein
MQTKSINKPFGQRLSTGEKNRRFQGSIKSTSIQQRWHDSSGALPDELPEQSCKVGE